MTEDDASEAAFEAAERFRFRCAGVESFAVVGPAQSIETEGKIENLIKAKGFTDVMVYYDTERTDVIVKTDGLLSNEAAQIKDIILKETEIPAENITIVEVN